MPLYLDERDVAGLLTMREAVDAVDAAFRAQGKGDGATNQPRQRIFAERGVLHYMAAALPGAGVLGTKTYTSFASGARFYVQLFSAETGELLAYIEADKLGQMRTGAATGVAARYMARSDAQTAVLLGAGWQAESQAEGLAATCDSLRTVRVFSRDRERREGFCARMAERLGLAFKPVETVAEAVAGAEVVVCATGSPTPILNGAMLGPGMFVAAVGANRLTAREIDEDVVGRAAITAVDDLAQARAEAAELIFAYERRRWNWSRAVPLADIVAGRSPGRTSPAEITLFKSLGIALEDIAVAAVVYRKAVAAGAGRAL